MLQVHTYDTAFAGDGLANAVFWYTGCKQVSNLP